MNDVFVKSVDSVTAIEIALIHKGEKYNLDRMKKAIKMLMKLSEEEDKK